MESNEKSVEADENSPQLEQRKIWDFPTRAFHWLLLLTVGIGYYIGDNLAFDNVEWHFRLGYATGALIVFRLVWGFVGGKASRFSDFFPTPSKLLNYARHMFSRKPSGTPGHNPIGALSVFALIATLLVLVVTGLFNYSDDYFTGGPLQPYVDESFTQNMAYWHELAGNLLFILVILHLAAIAFYWIWKRENLVRAMITGWKWVRKDK